MVSEPTPEQIERGRKIMNWALGIAYWLAIAPTLFIAGRLVAIAPLAIILEAAGISQESHPWLFILLGLLGIAAGISLVWIAWRQARSYYAGRAAA